MGIKSLFKFLSDSSPKAITTQENLAAFTGQTLAIDASTSLYQFLIAVRTGAENNFQQLTNKDGETTSHLTGFLSRAIRLVEAGIKPVFVFDGKPPEFKLQELAARREKQQKAKDDLKEALENQDEAAILKQSKRTVRADKKTVEDSMKLLEMIGCCVIRAPSEAEATCAELVKHGICDAAVTEDMDILTFGCPKMIKNMFHSLSGGKDARPITVIDLAVVLDCLSLTQQKFIDFCILCGCDL
jgi:flap endonuclease-1